MSFTRPSSLAVLIALISTGCVDNGQTPPQPEPTAETAVSAATEVKTPESELQELSTSSSATGAFPVAAGSFLNGTFTIPSDGQASQVAVKIGNYAGKADGNVSILLCQDTNCASGERSLAGSQDNGYLEIPLERSFDIVAGKPVSYRIAKVGGANQVALWLYTPTESMPAARANDKVNLDGAPKIAIRR